MKASGECYHLCLAETDRARKTAATGPAALTTKAQPTAVPIFTIHEIPSPQRDRLTLCSTLTPPLLEGERLRNPCCQQGVG